MYMDCYYICRYIEEFNLPETFGPKNRNVFELLLYGPIAAEGWTSMAANNFRKHYFPHKPIRNRYVNFILEYYNLAYCKNCDTVKPLEDFHNSNSRTNGKATLCKVCGVRKAVEYGQTHIEHKRYKDSLRRAKILRRTPSWATLPKIQDVYENCPQGYAVDHIIPLQGNNVSGLHIAENLQYLTPSENASKGNRYEIQ